MSLRQLFWRESENLTIFHNERTAALLHLPEMEPYPAPFSLHDLFDQNRLEFRHDVDKTPLVDFYKSTDPLEGDVAYLPFTTCNLFDGWYAFIGKERLTAMLAKVPMAVKKKPQFIDTNQMHPTSAPSSCTTLVFGSHPASEATF